MLSQTMEKEKVCLDVPNLNFKKSSLNEVITIPVEIILYCFDYNFLFLSFPKQIKKQTIKFTIFSLYHSATKALKSW